MKIYIIFETLSCKIQQNTILGYLDEESESYHPCTTNDECAGQGSYTTCGCVFDDCGNCIAPGEQGVARSDTEGMRCTPPKSVKRCERCLETRQCKEGYCCPRTKLCFSNRACRFDHDIVLAMCNPLCLDNMDPKSCNCSHEEFPDKWIGDTCQGN